jgi:hypothetical protein
VVAWTSFTHYEIKKACKSIANSLFSGEGFVYQYTGPGTVYVQTRSLKVSNLGPAAAAATATGASLPWVIWPALSTSTCAVCISFTSRVITHSSFILTHAPAATSQPPSSLQDQPPLHTPWLRSCSSSWAPSRAHILVAVLLVKLSPLPCTHPGCCPARQAEPPPVHTSWLLSCSSS